MVYEFNCFGLGSAGDVSPGILTATAAFQINIIKFFSERGRQAHVGNYLLHHTQIFRRVASQSIVAYVPTRWRWYFIASRGDKDPSSSTNDTPVLEHAINTMQGWTQVSVVTPAVRSMSMFTCRRQFIYLSNAWRVCPEIKYLQLL